MSTSWPPPAPQLSAGRASWPSPFPRGCAFASRSSPASCSTPCPGGGRRCLSPCPSGWPPSPTPRSGGGWMSGPTRPRPACSPTSPAGSGSYRPSGGGGGAGEGGLPGGGGGGGPSPAGPARLYGLKERGRLVPGWYADVVVFDPATVGPREERTRDDLPGGASRIVAEAQGVEHVLVNGTEIARSGAFTGATPGR